MSGIDMLLLVLVPLLAVGVLTCLLPARRAAQADPGVLLKSL